MIGRLTGTIAERAIDGSIVLDVNGVGYELFVPLGTLGKLGPGITTLHVHTHVREDALVLYGFATPEDRSAFRTLLGVSSVGPKLALAVLGSGPVSAVLGAIAAGDTRFFQSVSGVGKRTAERIIVELREKVGAALGEGIVMSRAAGSEGPRELAREGLLELGYAPPEAERLLAEVAGDSAEELIAAALRATRRGSAEAA